MENQPELTPSPRDRQWPLALLASVGLCVLALGYGETRLGGAGGVVLLPLEILLTALGIFRLKHRSATRVERTVAACLVWVGSIVVAWTAFKFLFVVAFAFLLGHSNWTYF